MKPSSLIFFAVVGALTVIGIVVSLVNNDTTAAIWAVNTLLWILIALCCEIDLESQKKSNDIQEEIIKTQEDLIKCQKEIIKELEQLQ